MTACCWRRRSDAESGALAGLEALHGDLWPDLEIGPLSSVVEGHPDADNEGQHRMRIAVRPDTYSGESVFRGPRGTRRQNDDGA